MVGVAVHLGVVTSPEPFGQQNTPINRGFRGTYLFYVPFMVEPVGIEPTSEKLLIQLSPGAVCLL